LKSGTNNLTPLAMWDVVATHGASRRLLGSYRQFGEISPLRAHCEVAGRIRRFHRQPSICHNFSMCGRYRLSRRKQLVEEYFGAGPDPAGQGFDIYVSICTSDLSSCIRQQLWSVAERVSLLNSSARDTRTALRRRDGLEMIITSGGAILQFLPPTPASVPTTSRLAALICGCRLVR
jgi:hypothetical protein